MTRPATRPAAVARPDLRPPTRRHAGAFLAACVLALPWGAAAQTFRFPTANRSLIDGPDPAAFFAPTPGRSWTAGQFGCVRSDGWQMHEGIDILAQHKDRRGEPTDEVVAAAGGTVAYVNRKPSLSNYGNYLVLRHRVEGIDVFTLYAHLREIRAGLAAGSSVKAGAPLGILGRTTNTRTPITRDRAHLHFEIDLLLNERFSSWIRKVEPGTRDDHGAWNGRNLLGVDPTEVLRLAAQRGASFSFLEYLRQQRPMYRVLVAETRFPWLRRYPQLIRRNARAESEGIVAYEVSCNYNGLPFLLVPRARSEIEGPLATRLLAVDAAEYQKHPCRKLVFKRGQAWTLTARGQQLLDLLVF